MKDYNEMTNEEKDLWIENILKGSKEIEHDEKYKVIFEGTYKSEKKILGYYSTKKGACSKALREHRKNKIERKYNFYSIYVIETKTDETIKSYDHLENGKTEIY